MHPLAIDHGEAEDLESGPGVGRRVDVGGDEFVTNPALLQVFIIRELGESGEPAYRVRICYYKKRKEIMKNEKNWEKEEGQIRRTWQSP